MSISNSDTKNIRLGACTVTYKGQNLGLTIGGVELDVTTETRPTTVDQHGLDVITDTVTKHGIKVMAPLAETTMFNLVAVMPGANLIEVGGSRASGHITYNQNVAISEDAKSSIGKIRFSANPANNSTITINGVVFTFKTTLSVPAVASQIKIGATRWDTATSLINALRKSKHPKLINTYYRWLTSTVYSGINIQRVDKGEAGNAFTLATSTPSIFFPVYTLAGGSATAKGFANVIPSINPTNDSTLTINGVVFTFKTALTVPAVDTEILIGANLAATLTAAAVVLNASVDVAVALATYTVTATQLKIEADIEGAVYANAFTVDGNYPGAVNKFIISAGLLFGGQDFTLGDSITINGTRFLFKNIPEAFTDILIGETLSESLTNASLVLNTSANPGVSVTNVTSGLDPDGGTTDTILTIESDRSGVAGNLYTFSTEGLAGIASNDVLSGGIEPSSRRVDVISSVGTNLRATAGRLTLHPVDLADDDFSEDVIIPLAGTAGAMKYSFKHDQERIYPVEFIGYVDIDTKMLFKIGDAAG